jgi:hypothetical protein
MPNFKYQPLDRDNREIRLIILEDRDGNALDLPLKCKFVTTTLNLYKEPLNDYPAYEVNKLRNAIVRSALKAQPYSEEFYALSYVWGNPEATHDIEINGTTAQISANLHAALISVRNNTKYRVIWADALSINQHDTEEKSWQVQQMSMIYSRARATIAWLGLASDDSKLALESLIELHKTTHSKRWNIQAAMEGDPPVGAVKKSIQQFASDSSRWNAVANICARPYWSRIWIFQEMVCARDKYFLCGNTLAKDIDRPIALLLAWQGVHGAINDNSLDSRCLSMIDSIQTFRFFGDYPSDAPYYLRPGTLHDMLTKLNNLNATDSRDLIYAPLGIATDGDQLQIVIDYSQSLDQILIETSCALLRGGSLEVLLSAGLQDNSSRLPSWVPDWSANLEPYPSRFYRASKGHSQRTSTLKAIPQRSDTVTLDGYLVGRISRISNVCPLTALESSDTNTDVPTFGDWLGQVATNVFQMSRNEGSNRKPKSGYHTVESNIAELLCAPPGARPVWSILKNPYIHLYKALRSAKSLQSLLRDISHESPRKQDRNLMRCVSQILNVLKNGSKPYQTESGFMGLTWKDRYRLGDLVVVIPGVSMPCILRRLIADERLSTTQTDNHYRVVGLTYVQGIMEGEFLKKKKNAPSLQVFTLC